MLRRLGDLREMFSARSAVDASVSRRMSGDWDRRARSDALYYVALGHRNQSWQDFFSGAEELIPGLERELDRITSTPAPADRQALEIGCGPGRLMLPMSRHFREIHGVDVSAGMVRLARQNLAHVPQAHVQVGDGTGLEPFSDESFDFVYSYAVFQHIPSRDVVLNYLRETRRVLRDGGVARLQFNGLKQLPGQYDTWSGVRFSAAEIAAFARESDLQLLALEGTETQYMWGTFRKRRLGWFQTLESRAAGGSACTIHRITSTECASPVIPTRGRYAAFSLAIANLPADADLNSLRIEVNGCESKLTYIGPVRKSGFQQVTASLPEGLSSGLQPVRLFWAGAPLGPGSFLRTALPGPTVPRVVSVTDAVCAGSGPMISSGRFRVALDDTPRPEDLRVTLDGRPALWERAICTAPQLPRFEVDFKLPAGTPQGKHRLACWHGRRFLGTWEIVAAPDPWWWWRRIQPAELMQSLRRFRP